MAGHGMTYRHLMLLLALGLAGCSSREVLVVYSPHGQEMLGDYEKLFEAAHPGVDVQWMDMGSEETFARIRAERGRPAGDVWWGAPSTMFRLAAQEGLLEPYQPTWAECVKPEYRDPKQQWYATFLSPLAIMFNTRGNTRDSVPHAWDDLLDPKWTGRITIRKPPPSGTMRTFLDAMIVRAPDENAGLAWLKRLHAATENYPESPALLFDHLKKQEGLISVWLMPDIVLQRERNGFPFDFYLPAQTPVIAEGIAIIKNAPHPAWARKFYEFVTTKEALAHQAKAYGKPPARTDLDPATLPAWLTQLAVDPMPMDWERLGAREKAWCARWEREVYQAP